jgi:hypothetical protein
MPPSIGRAALLALIASLGCSEGEYELERRGGPYPSAPIPDPATGGSGGSSGGAGSGGSAGAAGEAIGGAGESPIAFCEALTVVQAKCQRCHGDPLTNGAPVPFLTWEDFQAQYGVSDFMWWQIAEDMVDRDQMPYVALNGSAGLEGGPVEPLTPDEKATLLGWLQQGALPEGGTDCEQ